MDKSPEKGLPSLLSLEIIEFNPVKKHFPLLPRELLWWIISYRRGKRKCDNITSESTFSSMFNLPVHYKRLFWLLPLCYLLAGIIFYAIVDHHIGIAGDQTTYLLIGKSISQGEGFQTYHAFNLLENSETISRDMSPILYPIIIAGVLWVTNNSIPFDGILYIKVVNFILYLGVISLFYLLLLQWAGPRFPFLIWATILLAFHPGVLLYVNNISTEILYLFTSLASLWSANRLVLSKTKSEGRHFWIFSFSVYAIFIATYFSRFIGATLIGAMLLTLALNKKWRQIWTWCGTLSISALFIFWLSPYERQQLSFLASPRGEARIHNLWEFVSDWIYIGSEGGMFYLREIPMVVSGITVNMTAWVLPKPEGAVLLLTFTGVWSCVIPGIIRSYKKGCHLLEFYVILYIGLVVLFPVQSPRYLVPMIPFFLYYFFMGLEFWLEIIKLSQDRNTKVMIVFAALVAVSVTLIFPRQYITTMFISHQKPTERGYPAGWAEYYSATDWMKQHVPRDAKVVCKLPRLLSTYTGQIGMLYPFTFNSYNVQYLFMTSGIDYIIRDGFENYREGSFYWWDTSEQYLDPVLSLMEKDGQIEPVYQTGPHSDPTVVWKIKR